MRSDERVVVLGEDVGRGGVFGQYRGLQSAFGPARVIDTPISESTILGAAVGMALAGLRPVVEMRVVDFALCAMDEIVNQAAKARYMFGGQGARADGRAAADRPVERLGRAALAEPGGLVRARSGPGGGRAGDPAGQLLAAARPHSPAATPSSTSSTRNSGAWRTRSTRRAGSRWARPRCARRRIRPHDRHLVAHACTRRSKPRRSRRRRASRWNVIDLRTLWPWDRDAVLGSAARTGRVLVAHEAVQVAGFGAEIAASARRAHRLRASMRLGAPRIPVGYATTLEDEARITPQKIAAAAIELAARPRR